MRKTRVTTNTGKRLCLMTDDTLTLAFPGMVESTPAQLRAQISSKSLRRIARESDDQQERIKAARALELELQLSDHGLGRKSAQVFRGSELVTDCNLTD